MSEETKSTIEYSENTPVFCILYNCGFGQDGFGDPSEDLAEQIRKVMCDPRFYAHKSRSITVDLVNEVNAITPDNKQRHLAYFRIMVCLQ